jgi:uncharacterized protein (TIGR03086 family)
MDELLGMLQSCLNAFGERMHAIGADQWDGPTPDTDWSVADLAEHVVEEHRWVPPLMNGHDLDAAGKIVEGMKSPAGEQRGSDLVAEWDHVARASAEAFGAPDALDQLVSLSRGPTPARQYLGEMIFDLVVHSWDLGTAVSFTGELPADAVAFIYGQVQAMGDMSGSGMFAPPVEVPDSAAMIDKLVAATGRNPH